MVEKEAKAGPLSERELELLRLVATGATNQQIARELVISINTVKVHLRNIFEKLGVESRTEATLVAIREGWVTVEGAPVQAEETPARDEPPPTPAVQPLPAISRWQRVFLVVAMVVVAALAFVPPLGARFARPEGRNPFTERSQAGSPFLTEERAARWVNMAAMPTARARLAGVYYDGRVYAIGGDTDTGVTGSMEAFDLALNRWVSLPEKPTPASNVGAAVAGGRIWVPGGFLSNDRFSADVEVYDLETETWTAAPSLPLPLCGYALASLDDVLYLFGGANDEGYQDVALRYDVAAGAWQPLPALPSRRAFAAAAVLNDKIYLVGGYDGENELDACLVFDPAAGADAPWSDCAPLSAGRGGLGLAAVGSTLYAVGGGWDGYLTYNEQWDAATQRWTSFDSPLTGQWRNLAVVSDDQKVYVFGGWNESYLSSMQAYQAVVTIFLPITR